jgi:P-type Cu2+ transporter
LPAQSTPTLLFNCSKNDIKHIRNSVKEASVLSPEDMNFSAITYKGVEAGVEEKNIKVVSPGYLKEKEMEIPEAIYSSEAETVIYVVMNDKLVGMSELFDETREQPREAINAQLLKNPSSKSLNKRLR